MARELSLQSVLEGHSQSCVIVNPLTYNKTLFAQGKEVGMVYLMRVWHTWHLDKHRCVGEWGLCIFMDRWYVYATGWGRDCV